MRNPVRRSRKIGKTQGGRVKNGRPQEKWSKVFTEDVWVRLSRGSGACQVLRENPSRDHYHPCRGSELRKVLVRLPRRCTENVKAIVLRRLPKLDAKRGVEARQRYSCAILNAFPVSNEMVWLRSPGAAVVRHYEPWCSNWAEKSGRHVLTWTREEVRRYYLYHLLLHEVGHLNAPHFHRRKQREDYAEDFALEWAKKLGQLKKVRRER